MRAPGEIMVFPASSSNTSTGELPFQALGVRPSFTFSCPVIHFLFAGFCRHWPKRLCLCFRFTLLSRSVVNCWCHCVTLPLLLSLSNSSPHVHNSKRDLESYPPSLHFLFFSHYRIHLFHLLTQSHTVWSLWSINSLTVRTKFLEGA
jgi:hypothetical protein